MKQNDIILVIVAVFIGGALSIVVSKTVLGSSNRNVEVEVVEKISDEFLEPSETYFNPNAFNPTQNILIGEGGQVIFGN